MNPMYCMKSSFIIISMIVFFFSSFYWFLKTVKSKLPNDMLQRVDFSSVISKEIKKEDRIKTLSKLHDFVWNTLDGIQNGGNCEDKKLLRCENKLVSGFGSMVHRYAICLHIAFALNRTFFIDQPQHAIFGGLDTFTKLGSGRCSYLTKTLKTITNKCNFHDRYCYTDGLGLEIDNSYHLLEFTNEATFPAPKYIPRTIPKNLNEALKRLNVKRPWHWFTSQLLGYMILRPSIAFEKTLKRTAAELNLQKPVIGMHIRHGDKLTKKEAEYIPEEIFATMIQNITRSRGLTKPTIYLASDDDTIKDKLLKLTDNSYKIKSLTKREIRKDSMPSTMEQILLILHFLSKSDYVICTYSSNIGRLVLELKTAMYPYEADDKVVSVDWDIFYEWYAYSAHYTYILATSSSNITSLQGHSFKSYSRGQLFRVFEGKLTFQIQYGDTSYDVIYARKKEELYNNPSYFPIKDYVLWPGSPNYIFDIESDYGDK